MRFAAHVSTVLENFARPQAQHATRNRETFSGKARHGVGGGGGGEGERRGARGEGREAEGRLRGNSGNRPEWKGCRGLGLGLGLRRRLGCARLGPAEMCVCV